MKMKNYLNYLSMLLCFVWISDLPAQNGWEQMEDMLQASSWYGSCFNPISERAYIFGGSGPSETLFLLNTTQIYDFNTDTWLFGADMPNAASSFTAEMVNGKIYIIGEYRGPQILASVMEYDPVSDEWATKGPLPEIFYAHGSCVYDGLIYLFGGNVGGSTVINTVRSYDPSTDTLNELADMPDSRMKSAVCIYEDEIYLFGGNPSLKYTPSSDSWSEINADSCKIDGYQVPIIDGDRILLFGGYKYGGNYPNPCSEIWAYYPIVDTLMKLDNEMPFNRFTNGHKYNNYVYLFGGHYNNTLGSVTSEVWRVDLDYLSSINENDNAFREDFILYQNHPNPFSGSTLITYELLERAFISIDVFDVLGKKVACLMNDFQGIGRHEIEWNSNGLHPGIYFVALSDGKTQQHVKMNISK